MGTVGRKIAEEIRDNNGYYETDPRVMRIVEYDNAWGEVAYGLEYTHELGRYSPSQFIIKPRVFFEVKD